MLYEVIDNFAYYNPGFFDFMVNFWLPGFFIVVVQGVMVNKIINKSEG